MRFGLEQIDKTADKIRKETLSHVDTVVIGDNSSGKSLLLKRFIESIPKWTDVYFIDAVNRGFDVKEVPKVPDSGSYGKKLMEMRLEAEYFNLRDSFSFMGTSVESVERVYPSYEEQTQQLFKELTGDSFQITSQAFFREVKFEEGNGLLSTGYQALIRILVELLYYEDKAVKALNIQHPWIVIDEIDEFLSPHYAAKILPFLRQKFPWAHWLVFTHSADLVAAVSDANLILLENGNCELLDSNDYTSLSEVQIIFDRLFGKAKQNSNQVDAMLRRLMNNKMNHLWDAEDENCLEQIQKESLSASQQLILRQIQSW